MSIRGIVKKLLSYKDLDGFTEQELSLVYAGQVKGMQNIKLNYYDTHYYDTHYYDTHYYDTHYYDTHYSERSGPYPNDPSGPHYSDSSYSNSAGC